MRYFDFTISPEDGAIHPADKLIADQPGVTRDALMHVNSLGDGTGVLLYRICGDPESVTEVIDESNQVLAWDVLDVQDDVFHLYLHIPPGQPAGGLMALAQKYALIIDTPLKYTDQGGLRTTIVGTHEMLRKALGETPDGVRFAVEQAGQYSPDREDILSILTERQHEVFETAISEGYYEIPREATHEDISNALGCAPSTVDEHLRKAESRVLSALMR